jgi:hypothetical protein
MFLSMLTMNWVIGLKKILPKNELRTVWANSENINHSYFLCGSCGWQRSTFWQCQWLLICREQHCWRFVRRQFFPISPLVVLIA